MTVSSTTSRVDYTGNGSLAIYPYPFRILESTDLVIHVDDVLTTDYTVTGVGNAGGGNVIFNAAPASSAAISIVRSIPETQESHYVENDAFSADTTETALDKLTMLVQQNSEAVGRAVSVASTSTQKNLVIDDLVANKFLRVKADASGLEMYDITNELTVLPAIIVADTSGTSAAIAPATLYTAVLGGMYRISASMLVSTAGTGNVTFNVIYNNGQASKTKVGSTISLVTLGADAGDVIDFYVPAGQQIEYSTDYTGTGSYDLHIRLEYLA